MQHRTCVGCHEISLTLMLVEILTVTFAKVLWNDEDLKYVDAGPESLIINRILSW
jgi:hypothetical protein